jgi:hypothetical protein
MLKSCKMWTHFFVSCESDDLQNIDTLLDERKIHFVPNVRLSLTKHPSIISSLHERMGNERMKKNKT